MADRALVSTSDVDLAHRAFVARARQGADAEELAEQAVMLITRLLESVEPRRVEVGRPGTDSARLRLVDKTRAVLHDNLSTRLIDLAQQFEVSPYHLSRVFHQITGMPFHQYRARLRARRALELLADGATNLARVAAEVGFADQAHLTRALRAELGTTPARLRNLLRPVLHSD